MAKPKKDKAMRSCTSCFTKRLEVGYLSLSSGNLFVKIVQRVSPRANRLNIRCQCPESEMPNRCVHCVGKTSYCKGPIETPRLYDLSMSLKGWCDHT